MPVSPRYILWALIMRIRMIYFQFVSWIKSFRICEYGYEHCKLWIIVTWAKFANRQGHDLTRSSNVLPTYLTRSDRLSIVFYLSIPFTLIRISTVVVVIILFYWELHNCTCLSFHTSGLKFHKQNEKWIRSFRKVAEGRPSQLIKMQ